MCEVGDRIALFRRLALTLGRFQQIDQFVVPIDRQRAMRRKAFDCEWPGYADAAVVGIGLVIEKFVVGFGSDRGIDFLLPRDARLPEAGEGVPRGRGPGMLAPRARFPIP